jgi:hypothetical protein
MYRCAGHRKSCPLRQAESDDRPATRWRRRAARQNDVFRGRHACGGIFTGPRVSADIGYLFDSGRVVPAGVRLVIGLATLVI